jgi:hypothetical protein
MDMRFRLWNVMSLYRVSSLMAVLRELLEYKLHLVRVLVVRWENVGIVLAREYTFFCRKGMKIMS